MKKIATLLLCLFVGISSIQLNAQTTDFNNVKKLLKAEAIISNGEVIGYFTFLFLDKENKKENLYELDIMDKNLKVTYKVELVKDKHCWLLESKFNDDRFCFSFINHKEKRFEYVLFDKQGKKIAEYNTEELTKKEMQMMAAMMSSEDDNYSGSLIGVPGKGFVRYAMDKEDGWRMEMEMIDNSGKKLWKATSNSVAKKVYESGFPMYANKNVVASLLSSREKMMSKDVNACILFNDPATGKELFRTQYMSSGNKFSPIGVSFDESTNEYFVYGEYYKEGDNMKDKSEGYFFQSYSTTGVKNKESFVSWTKDIAKVLPVDKNGKFGDGLFVTLHTMIRTADGKMYAIGEEYKKAVSAMGVASMLLNASGGGQGNVALIKIETYNMLIFEFDQNLKIVSAKEIEKEKTNVQLPQGYGMLSTPMLGFMLKSYGEFDYAYTALSKDKKTFTSAYVDYDKEKGATNNYVIGTIGVGKDGKLGSDKLRLSDKPTDFFVMPCKPGYVAVLKYYRKEKKLSWDLEKTGF